MSNELPVLLDLTSHTPTGNYRFDTAPPDLPTTKPGVIAVTVAGRSISHLVVVEGASYHRAGIVPVDGGPTFWEAWKVMP